MLHKKIFASFVTLAFIALCYTNVSAETVFAEIEPNNTLATGQLLSSADGSVRVANAFRESSPTNDFNDFYRFTANAGNLISIRVVPVGTTALTGDPVLRLLGLTGLTLLENDDCAGSLVGTNPLQSCILNFSITTTGTYGVGIRGFADSVFNYDLIITGLPTSVVPPNPVPEPATMLLLGTGLVGVVAKVRRGRKTQE